MGAKMQLIHDGRLMVIQFNDLIEKEYFLKDIRKKMDIRKGKGILR